MNHDVNVSAGGGLVQSKMSSSAKSQQGAGQSEASAQDAEFDSMKRRLADIETVFGVILPRFEQEQELGGASYKAAGAQNESNRNDLFSGGSNKKN